MKFTKYIVTTIIGLAAAFAIMCYKGIFYVSGAADAMQILSDAFLVPGVFIMGVGLIVVAANGGTFDMLGYAVRMIFDGLKRDLKNRKYKDFAEYREARKDRKIGYGYLLITGAAFIALAVLFLLIWYNC